LHELCRSDFLLTVFFFCLDWIVLVAAEAGIFVIAAGVASLASHLAFLAMI
jgi:hypothetical protein